MYIPRLYYYLIFTCFICFCSSCKSNYESIDQGIWKYGSGYHCGDVLDFINSHHLIDDTIFLNSEAKGTILVYSKESMFVKDIRSSSTGMYHHKE